MPEIFIWNASELKALPQFQGLYFFSDVTGSEVNRGVFIGGSQLGYDLSFRKSSMVTVSNPLERANLNLWAECDSSDPVIEVSSIYRTQQIRCLPSPKDGNIHLTKRRIFLLLII
jgi:hypothetical protein